MHDYPQRVSPPSPPGTLLKRLDGVNARLRMRASRNTRTERDDAYLKLIRQLPCVKCGMEPPPHNEAAHIRRTSAAHGKSGALAKKPADCWTAPLCAACHRTDRDALHQIGEDLFFHILGIDPLLLCERLWARRGDFLAMRAVVTNVIAERTSFKHIISQK